MRYGAPFQNALGLAAEECFSSLCRSSSEESLGQEELLRGGRSQNALVAVAGLGLAMR